MTAALLVGLFGVAGALLRFAADSWFAQQAARQAEAGNGARHWPWATLLVNMVGCFVIGAAAGVTGGLGLTGEWQTALATGLAGGLTTFSSWTTATVRLISEARYGAATVNVTANLALGVAAAAAGMAVTG
ncbi:camphor resistance protein CrcB [Arthrobacter sp. ZBG10]|uniref:fluoride efflux transporter FluC n=1 Tax=unclassified Arthrobacter TaxID=235627 RepID=UPI000680B700|nr:CrcB family protein [Arthrobacter sp. ZBG10]KNH17159.1 camphor resistance protein CrcB [Arthrobacter sp. ZBG10]